MADARVSVLIDLRSKLAGLEAAAQGFAGLIKLAAGFATAYLSVRSVVAGALDIIELGAELEHLKAGLRYTYTSTGFLTAITDHQGRNWWDSPTYDQEGRVIQARKGTVWTRRDYRESDGSLATIRSGFSAGSNTLQDLAYTFDNLGNLTSRTDAYRTHQGTGSPTAGLSETFGYDNLNRYITRNGATAATYATNGNITWKKDVAGTGSGYTYGSSKPHAVTSAFGYTIGYDANGLMASRTKTGQTTPWSFTWTRSNMIKWIFDGLDGSEYEYDGSDSRIKEIRTVSGQEVEKKIFCPGFEQFFDKDASGNWKAKLIRVHIGAPDGVAGVFEYKPNQTSMATAQSLTLLFTDHLGSVDLAVTIPGSSLLNFVLGSTRQKYSYDPWGQRRDETTWSGAHELTSAELAAQHTDRGFTGHEMLDELGLINMNARIYDPQLGRFLSADTIVQSPGSLQSYNRYSYCGNNPLCRIDPSGHLSFTWNPWKALKETFKFVKKYWVAIVAVVLAVVTAGVALAIYYGTATLMGGFSLLFGGSAILAGGSLTAGFTVLSGVGLGGSILAGALAGAVSGAITSGTLEGAAWGALGGAVTGAIGASGWNIAARAAAHGISGGLMSEAQGGTFAHGMYSGVASTVGAAMVPGNSNYVCKLVASAVVGGTASRLGGGKFENGAVTGAFRFIINDGAHRIAGSNAQKSEEERAAEAQAELDRIHDAAEKWFNGYTDDDGVFHTGNKDRFSWWWDKGGYYQCDQYALDAAQFILDHVSPKYWYVYRGRILSEIGRCGHSFIVIEAASLNPLESEVVEVFQAPEYMSIFYHDIWLDDKVNYMPYNQYIKTYFDGRELEEGTRPKK